MTEEIKTSNEPKEKNTVALVWMICSIVWLILLLTIIWIGFGVILLTIWFILWIIGLFYKPRGKARVAVIIPAIIGIAAIIWLVYVKNSIATPASEFASWIETISDNEIYSNIMEDDDFWNAISNEFKEIITSKNQDELKELYNTSSWSNAIEKWSYVFFGFMKESIENSLEKYGLDSEISDTDDEDLNEEEIDEESDETDNDEINDEEEVDEEVEETESVEIFNNSEKSDIEEIINILE